MKTLRLVITDPALYETLIPKLHPLLEQLGCTVQIKDPYVYIVTNTGDEGQDNTIYNSLVDVFVNANIEVKTAGPGEMEAGLADAERNKN